MSHTKQQSLVFSGVQPTGNLHLGNYLGAIKNWVKLQQEHRSIFCIVDLHAITVPQDPAHLRDATYQTLATYLACGIDAKENILFAQSSVPGHSELAWILGCHTPLGWLERMTQFKEKAGIRSLLKDINAKLMEIKRLVNADTALMDVHVKFMREKLDQIKECLGSDRANSLIKEAEEQQKKHDAKEVDLRGQIIEKFMDLHDELKELDNKRHQADLGLYSYPVLMAADILLYKATHVPVGEDQKQHLELARDIAGAFNRAYQQEYLFPLPEPLILGEGTRVMSLRDGTKKMSKSDESDYSRINLTDDADAIAQKFKKAKSDATMGFETLEGRPEAVNLLTIYAALAETSMKAAQERFMQSGFAALKKELAEVAAEKLGPISAEIKRLMGDKAYLGDILKQGAGKANAIAEGTLREVKALIGFVG
jgi:tryptophanyl-tRNA synthetase